MKAKSIDRKAIKIKATTRHMNIMVLMIIVLLITLAGYALWNS